MEQSDLVASLRKDQLLCQNRDNARFAPPTHCPCPFYMLAYHRDRIVAAGQAANRTYPNLEGDEGLDFFAAHIQEHVLKTYGDKAEEALKIRVVVSPSGGISVTSGIIHHVTQSTLFPRSLDDICNGEASYRVFISPSRSKPSFHTRYKTTNRSTYDEIRSVLPRADENDLPAEVLLVNEDGDIMEGTITTPYFKQGSTWVTPAESSGGNLGTTRRWTLGRGLCEEYLVSANSILLETVGEKVVLSNGVRGFGWGKVESLMKVQCAPSLSARAVV